MESKKQHWLQLLGPGLLFAGAAVGVSHLVLSTKAGAAYGFGLVWLILLANLMKYPFFEAGPRYAMATGKSLLQGYQQLGNWVLVVFCLVTLGTMFTVQAAVTIVTAGLAAHLFGLGSIQLWVVMLLVICALLLLIGRYKLLDGLMKVIIISLTGITLIAVLIAIIYYQPKATPLSWTQYFNFSDKAALLFFASVMGWMPAPLDLSVWHSLWTLEKQKDNSAYSSKRSFFDFNVGYVGTTILALFFLSLGALVMFGSGTSFSPKGGVFAGQLIKLYTDTLGSGAAVFVAIAAFITMFSTTITCLDALPRAMSKATFLFIPEEKRRPKTDSTLYWLWMLILIAGTMLILLGFTANMGTFVMVATVLSFITTPFFAIVNTYLANKLSPKPAKWIRYLSIFGILYLIGFCVLYLWGILS